MENCDVCNVLETHNNGRDVEVMQTDSWRAVLDEDQRSLGKMFVTLLEHKPNLESLSREDAAELFVVMQALERQIKNAYNPSHFNWQCLMNLAIEAGQETHVHWHLHPRYDSPVDVDGEVFHDGVKNKTAHIVNREKLVKIRQDILGETTGNTNGN